MDWIQQWQSKLNKQNGVAPLVRTGGSRHTGLAALPYRNIHTAEALCYDKHFSITASGDNITLFINLDTVMQIYENLLSNSIRYAKSDIAISVVIENNNLVISVSDDGCGFKNIEIEKVEIVEYKGE